MAAAVQLARDSLQRPSSFPARRVSLDNDALVDGLELETRCGRTVANVMRLVDRKFFIRPCMPSHFAYEDRPLPIGYEQTISAPHLHATVLELLKGHLQPGAAVLDVGSGSGYLSACMGVLVGRGGGSVVGIEQHPQLVARSRAALQAARPELLERGTVRLIAGNALAEGALDGLGPFDAIHVGAAASHLPLALVAKLKRGGRMAVPVAARDPSLTADQDYQVLQTVDKSVDGAVTVSDVTRVRFVPLVKPQAGKGARQ